MEDTMLWARAFAYVPGIHQTGSLRALGSLRTYAFEHLGVPNQDDLPPVKPGQTSVDIKMVMPPHDTGSISFEEAVNLAVDTLEPLASLSADDKRYELARVSLFHSPNTLVRQVVIAQNQAICVEYLIAEEQVRSVLEGFQENAEGYVALKALALGCLENRNITCQPSWFQTLVHDLLFDQNQSPKMPKVFKTSYEALVVFRLLKRLEAKGLKPSRSPTSPPKSGSDAVAEASRLVPGALTSKEYHGILNLFKAGSRLAR